MPNDLHIYVENNKELDVYNVREFPLSIISSVEDGEDYQIKQGVMSIGSEFPATLNNQTILGGIHINNSNTTTDKLPKKIQIVANGHEVLTGSILVREGTSINNRPNSFVTDIYAGNGDWVIKSKETTLAQCVNTFGYFYNVAAIQASWFFDGMSEVNDLVYAPVRYGNNWSFNASSPINKKVPYWTDFRPSISVYWTLVRGLRAAGYQLKSNFFDNPKVRKLVMPWTWGAFRNDNKYLQKYLFDAYTFSGQHNVGHPFVPFNGGAVDFFDTQLYNDYQTVGTDMTPYNNEGMGNGLGFDISNAYTYNGTNKEHIYTHPTDGIVANIILKFATKIRVTAEGGALWSAQFNVRVLCYKNGVQLPFNIITDNLWNISAGPGDIVSSERLIWTKKIQVAPNDVIKVKIEISHSGGGINNKGFGSIFFFNSHFWNEMADDSPLNSTFILSTMPGLQEYKFLDFVRGLTDCFDLICATDNINKIVYFEPAYNWQFGDQKGQGWFGSLPAKDWDAKQDINKQQVNRYFSDFEREFNFLHADDSNDGILKLRENLTKVKIGRCKFLFLERFKSGKKEHRNRFFAKCMHVKDDAFLPNSTLATNDIAGQIPLLYKQNTNTTSDNYNAETYKFKPRLLYYKGLIDQRMVPTDPGVMYIGNENNPPNGQGWATMYPFPKMFETNYDVYPVDLDKDPNLSYADEQWKPFDNSLAIHPVIRGLVRNFYLPRLCMYNNGLFCKLYVNIDELDFKGDYHRSLIDIKNDKWVLMKIDGYKPTIAGSTAVELFRVGFITKYEDDNVYPSIPNIANNIIVNSNDINYSSSLASFADLTINKEIL